MVRLSFLLPALFAGRAYSQAAISIASRYGLSTSTALPFPQATLNSSSTQSYISSKWGLSKGRIQNGGSNLEFVSDPFPDSVAPGNIAKNNTNSTASTSTPKPTPAIDPVLQVQYPAGSFQDNNDGGAQFYAMWNASGSPFQSMLVTYEVAFDADFDWVKGGKLPGLRGGPDPNNCSGGNQANGTNCFSSRVMWRKNGDGEVYAYVPRVNGICSDTGVQCNDQYGISLDRGSFVFASGQWNRVAMLVRLNSPDNVANGQVILYFNEANALQHDNMYFRQTDAMSVGGLYFSTFFGGSDSSWAPPNLTHTYFRNFQLYAGTSPSDLKGSRVAGKNKSAAQGRVQMFLLDPFVFALSVLFTLFV